MELVKQCVSLELAKQLKSLGVPQESLFYWGLEGRYLEGGEPKSYVTSNHYKVVYTTDGLGEFTTSYFETFYSAFTVAELYNLLYMHGIGDILLDGVKPEHLADYLGEKLCKAL